MKIFNTLTREKEEFVPIEQGKVKMYACGPTVYNFIHIGNARPICVFDTMRRYLEFKGYDVTFVQNFTDIDDKIIKKANEEGVTAKEIAERLNKKVGWSKTTHLHNHPQMCGKRSGGKEGSRLYLPSPDKQGKRAGAGNGRPDTAQF